LPAHELARLIREREVSAVEVMEAHVARIGRINPLVNAIVTFLPERALERARATDAAIARGDPPGPLAGLPVAHKDLVPTQGVRTTFGSPIFKDFVPDADAIIVERLRQAGAIMIGKTNTPEFGAGSQTFNPVFGATSFTVRAIGPSTGMSNQPESAGRLGTRPAEGRKPTTLQKLAGLRRLPPRSEPSAIATSPAASAAAAPPLLPPEVLPRS
jgi:hypothetical protein